MFDFICKYVKSSCCVEIETAFPEKILNRLQNDGIIVWNIKFNAASLVFWCLESDVSNTKNICLSYGRDFQIKNERGLPKIKKAISQNKVLIFSLSLCFAALIFMSSKIWKINIYSLRETEPSEVMKYLYSLGVKQSMSISELDITKLRADMLLYFDNFEDVQIERKGTELDIVIKEKNSVIVSYDKSLPVNIVAKEDALVDCVKVFNGISAVEAGEYVKAGDILISGEIKLEDANGNELIKKVHAMGNVCAYKRETFDDIYIQMYKPNENAPYCSDKYIKLGQRTFMLGRKESSQYTVAFKSYNNNIHFAWFEIPVLYDEIKWYNINDCTLKDEYEISEEIYSEITSKLGDVDLTDLVYSAQPYEDYMLKVEVSVEYTYNIGIEELIE